MFLLLLSNIGIAYIFEYPILNVYRAYRYKPKILKNNLLDNVLGAVISQGIIVPFTAVFLTAFNFGKKGKILFSMYYFFIERLFVKLGIYKQYWWKTIYTPILIYCYFGISNLWYNQIKKGNSNVLAITHFFCVNVVSINFLFVLAIMKKIKFGFGKVSSWHEHFLIVPVYSILLSFLAVLSVKKGGFKPKIIIFLIDLLIDLLLWKLNILKVKLNALFFFLLRHVLTIYCAVFFRKLVYMGKGRV
ncbi:hypothetical protein ACFSYB_00285 [Litchfieldia salsa]